MLRDLKRVLQAAGMILALSSFALAHDESSRGSYGSQQGFQLGYNAGYQHGRQDRAQRLGYDPRGDSNRRGNRDDDGGWYGNRGDRDNDSSYDNGDYRGNRNQSLAGYREGYRSGYDDGYYGRNQRGYGNGGYGRNGGYGNGGYGAQGPGYNNGAFNTGYRDGIDGAQQDIRENKRFDVNSHGWYRDADHGYYSGYGNKNSYRQQYRQGYETGYREVFDSFGYSNGGYGNVGYPNGGYGGYPNGGYGGYPNGGYGRGGTSDIAYATGYSDGIVGARKDMLERKSPDPTRHDWYQDANRGYDGRAYGNRNDYKQRYRQAYIAGYNDAYSGRGRGF